MDTRITHIMNTHKEHITNTHIVNTLIINTHNEHTQNGHTVVQSPFPSLTLHLDGDGGVVELVGFPPHVLRVHPGVDLLHVEAAVHSGDLEAAVPGPVTHETGLPGELRNDLPIVPSIVDQRVAGPGVLVPHNTAWDLGGGLVVVKAAGDHQTGLPQGFDVARHFDVPGPGTTD